MIEKKIKEKLKDIVFIELKKPIELKGEEFKNIPLPVKMNSILSGIKTGEIKEEFDLLKVTDAIVFLLGIEGDFKYRDEYVKLLFAVHDNLRGYILYLASKALKTSNLDSYIYLNSHKSIFVKDNELKFTKLGVLEKMHNEDNLDDEEKEEIIKTLLRGYEELSRENYSLSLYKLGHLNKSLGHNLKSMLYFKKFLEEDEHEELKDEVREEIEEVEDYARVEEGQTYLSYGKYKEAENAFDKVSENYPKKDEVFYYKSLIKYNTSQYEESVELIEQALQIEDKEEYYNQMALSLSALDRLEEGVSWLLKGLKQNEKSYMLNYNLGILYYNLKDVRYRDYLRIANEIRPSDEITKLLEM